MSEWDGDWLDDRGLVRILNPDGTRPPLIWCFNAQHEFPMLAQQLGPDQPVIGLRSLHLIARIESGRSALDIRLGDHYADCLLRALPDSPCFIGANCQGVGVSAQVAARWALAGRPCPDFIAMEMEPAYPLPLRGTLLFGAQSTAFNPHLRGDLAAPARWQTMFAAPSERIIPGGHGEYFTPQNIAALADTIRTILHRGQPPAAHAPHIRLRAAPFNRTAAPGALIPVDVQLSLPDGPLPAGLILAHIWRHAATRDVLPVSGQSLTGSSATVTIAAPAHPGEWELLIYPALQPFGPLCWQDHRDPVGRLNVPNEVPAV